MMTVFLCTACGTSYPEAAQPPQRCRICEDERQFVPAKGQGWVAREALAGQQRNAWQAHEAGLLSVQSVPGFAINQRAFLLRTPAGNVLWDCIALLDEATRRLVEALGGLHAIAISHPHYYTTMQDWAAAFAAPIHLHDADQAWIVRPDPAIRLWTGETFEIAPGATLIRAGGHFPGGTVLHWAQGALLSGDILQVTPGGDRVSFMWSYPNLLPLPAATVQAIVARLLPWRYERIYGAFPGRDVLAAGEAVVALSARRYLELLSGGAPA